MDDANRKRVLELAEQSEWDGVCALIQTNGSLAKAQDDFGMLPLHWMCTDPSVALDTLTSVLQAFPAACQLENLSGMLPLHVAISSKLPGMHIKSLLAAYPEAAFAKDARGRYPIELAVANNLPTYTTDLIRQAGARAARSPSVMSRSSSVDDFSRRDTLSQHDGLMKSRSIASLTDSSNGSDYGRLVDGKTMNSTEISCQLKELLTQLQQLSVDIRSGSSTTASTYRSSFSSVPSSFDMNPDVNSVLWNPADKFGFTLAPVSKDCGAMIIKFGSRSEVLGAEKLSVGDILLSINGASVVDSSFASITRFLKHSKVTCTLAFSKREDNNQSSKAAFGSMRPTDHDSMSYSKVAELLDMTLKKVSAIEESMRLSSAMSLCT